MPYVANPGSYMGLRSSAALLCSASSLFLRHDEDS